MGDPPDAATIVGLLAEEDRLRVVAARSRRRALLDWLGGAFEPGRSYPEPEVNRMLAEREV